MSQIAALLNPDLSNKRVMIGLSGGINSAGVLCYLTSEYYPKDYAPKEIYLFYSHLKEHSPDTFKFVKALIRYAQSKFEKVTWRVSRSSVNQFFLKQHIIPHPMLSPCSEHLKIIPMLAFMDEHRIDVDLVGYVRHERRRINRQMSKKAKGKLYPIQHLSDDDCFELVKREIGWYPAIYDIRENGKRVFKHNNCLPCKNMAGKLAADGVAGEYESVRKYYPAYFEEAQQTAQTLGAYWGRDKNFDGYCKTCED